MRDPLGYGLSKLCEINKPGNEEGGLNAMKVGGE